VNFDTCLLFIGQLYRTFLSCLGYTRPRGGLTPQPRFQLMARTSSNYKPRKKEKSSEFETKTSDMTMSTSKGGKQLQLEPNKLRCSCGKSFTGSVALSQHKATSKRHTALSSKPSPIETTVARSNHASVCVPPQSSTAFLMFSY